MRVGVVGAGITGLALTHYLADRDVDVVTFEAASRPGGAVWSERVDGYVLEYGPQRVRLVPTLEEVVDDLDLRSELLVADDDLPLYVYADGRLREVPRSLSAFLRTDLLSWRGKLRALAEPLTGDVDPDERAATAFERKFGTEAYRNVVEPLFGGVYGSDPAEMPAEYALDRLAALERRKGSLLRPALERVIGGTDAPPPVSFVDGLETLPDELYDAHRPYVHLETAVDAVRDAEGGGYVVDTGTRTATVDALVVTVPAARAASLLADVAAATVDPLARLTYNSLALVHLQADHDAEGFGYQVRRGEPLRTLGVTWNDSLFDRDGVHTAFLGGMHDPDVLDRSRNDIGEVARREFRDVMDADPTVLDVTKLPRALPAYDTSWSALDEVSLPGDIHLATNYAARVGVPARVREAGRLADELTTTARPT
jgi:oxygen-dependent protoporphyrinogen oxidase